MSRKHDVVKVKNAALKRETLLRLGELPAGKEWSSLWVEEKPAGIDTAAAWRAADRNRRSSLVDTGVTATFAALVQRSGTGAKGLPTPSEQRCGTAPVLVTMSLLELVGLVQRLLEAEKAR